jgi:CRP/FNR family transcriptional regulator, anaerobic regulatory protein
MRIPKKERGSRLLAQRAYVIIKLWLWRSHNKNFHHRMLQNLSMDAEERYLAFHKAHPELEQQIAQKHIASYLGMSAEFLSKIKKWVLQNKWR